MNRRTRTTMAGLMAWALVLVAMAGPAFSQEPPEVDEAQVKELEAKSKSIEARRRALQQKKQEKLQKAKEMTSQIVRNQRQLYHAQRKLGYHQNQLVSARTRLNQLAQDIDRTIGDTNRLTRDAGQRLRQLYTGGRVNMLQVLFEAEDIASFLDRLYYKRRLVAQDKQLLNQLKDKTQLLTRQREELAYQQQHLGKAIRNIRGLKQNIQGRLVHDKKLRQQYWKDAKYYEQAERELLAESAKIQNEIMKLTGEEPEAILTTGSFIWPIVGRITSNFGYRRHPIHRKRLMHTGLDIAQRHGASVKAADGGKCIYSGWRGGYGKVVMINHGKRGGKNVVTLYAHLSHAGVRKGQSVTKGQVIARVGSTGYATGPHLHFEVRENGRPVDPKPFLN